MDYEAYIESDVFILPSSIEDRFIIYSPLRNLAFATNKNATDIIRNFLKGNIHATELEQNTKLKTNLQYLLNTEITQPQKKEFMSSCKGFVILLLSHKCNLSCSYCYAQEQRSKKTLSIEKIKTVVDYMFENAEKEILTFSFMGGGEPTVTWNLLKQSVQYIQQKSKEITKPYNILLTTNATLLNEKRICYLKKNNIKLKISFEILPKIQDEQRPFQTKKMSSFEAVDKNIKMLLNYGVAFRVRSTITMLNVDLMPDMVSFVHSNYPSLSKLQFGPVTYDEDNSVLFYERYISSFFKARKIGKDLGISVDNTITQNFKSKRIYFCDGGFCITPSGNITSCPTITAETDSNFDSFFYGNVNESVHIDLIKKEKTEALFTKQFKECNECFAKYHCASGCPANRLSFSYLKQNRCIYVRKTTLKLLEEKLEL